MKKALLILVLCSGCSGMFANRQSPLKIDGCHLWAPIVDTTLAVGGASFIASVNESHLMEEQANAIVLGTVGMYATAFAISAVSGYAEYVHCRNQLNVKDTTQE